MFCKMKMLFPFEKLFNFSFDPSHETLRASIHPSCWRALARQQPILYNSEKKPKFVGCKIGDMRSQLRFLYPGIPGCL